MAVAEHNVPQAVLIKGVDFVNQEVINNSFVQVAAVEHNVHQVVVIKEADSVKQDNKHQNIILPKYYYYWIIPNNKDLFPNNNPNNTDKKYMAQYGYPRHYALSIF